MGTRAKSQIARQMKKPTYFPSVPLPGAAVTKYHKLINFKQQKFTLMFWKFKFEIKVLARPCSLWRLQGRTLPLFVSGSCCLLMRAPVFEFEPILIQYDLILTNYICKDLTYFQVRSNSEIPTGQEIWGDTMQPPDTHHHENSRKTV